MLLWLEVLLCGKDDGSCFPELKTWEKYFLCQSPSTSCLRWMLWLHWKAGRMFGYRLVINQLQAWQMVFVFMWVNVPRYEMVTFPFTK